MKIEENWDEIQFRFDALWKQENEDRPLMSIRIPNIPENRWTRFPDSSADRKAYWLDTEWVYRRSMHEIDHTEYYGEAFPIHFLNFGAAGHAGYFRGAEFTCEPNGIWFGPSLGDYQQLQPDPESELSRTSLNMARDLVAMFDSSVVISAPDIAGDLDALAHLRGNDLLLMDFYDHPERLKDALRVVHRVWTDYRTEVQNILGDHNQGASSIGWLGTWCREDHIQLQSDVSVMLSRELFSEFAMQELQAKGQAVKRPLYHLDGVEQVRHLEEIMSIPNLAMIQWTSVAGQASPLEYLSVLQRIQRAGIGLHLTLKPGEVETAVRNLSCRGLMIVVHGVADGEQANDIIRLAGSISQPFLPE